MEYAKDTASDYIPTGPGPSSFTDAVSRDPIATLRSLISKYEKYKTDFPELRKSFFKVPHAFQQQLSYQKTPTLCDTAPSFEAGP